MPPFGYIDVQGKNAGFDVEIARGSPATRSASANRVTFLCAPTAAREPLLTTRPRRPRDLDVHLHRRPRHAHRLLAAYYKATGRLLVKNDGAVQKLADIAGKTVATTSGSVYDRWMKNCFKGTKVIVADTFTNAMLAFNQGRADAVMYDDAVLLPIAAADPNLEAHGRHVPRGPVRHRHQAGQHRAEGAGSTRGSNLMSKKDAVLPDPEGERAGAVRGLVLEEHPASEQHVLVRGAEAPSVDDRVPVGARRPGGGRQTAAARSLLMLAVAFDLWAFVSDNWRRAPRRASSNTLKVSAIAIAGAFVIGLVLGAARAHRIPVVSQLTAVYVEVIRNTPILVQIFLIFFGLPAVRDPRSTPFTVAWLSVMLWGGAFNSENFRAGFLAVSRRHREAALALGFRPLGDVPQRDAPDRRPHRAAVVDQHVHLASIKNTSLMYVIGYPELTTTAINISA